VITWFKNGKIINPARNEVKDADIVVENEKIARILPPRKFDGTGMECQVFDADRKYVIPGLIDMHVHLREPGQEYKETVASGAKAAAAGGFTRLVCMPNTLPPNDCRSVTEFILEQAERAGTVRIYPAAAITVGQRGEALTEFGDLRRAGAVAVTDDGLPVVNSALMRRALEYARYHGLSVISHCEDLNLSVGGVMHEGTIATRIGLPGIPAAAEEIMVYREISLARLTGCPVHIAHVSTRESVALIRRAKEEDLPVTAETAPHYFSLDHSAVLGYDTRAKVNPPLRTAEDVRAIRQGLAEGVIDVIATDHAPHSPLEKEVEFDRAACGMIGLQTALPLTLELVREGVLELSEAVGKLSRRAAAVAGTGGGELAEGGDADLAVLDPEKEYVLREEDILSKSKNSPFIGRSLRGAIELTMIGGKVVWETKA
jgi:dihydroorotase